MGTIPSDGQWSISGGTGELTMARGIVNHKVVQEANGVSRVYEIEIHAYYTPMNSMVSGVAIPGIDVALLRTFSFNLLLSRVFLFVCSRELNTVPFYIHHSFFSC